MKAVDRRLDAVGAHRSHASDAAKQAQAKQNETSVDEVASAQPMMPPAPMAVGWQRLVAEPAGASGLDVGLSIAQPLHDVAAGLVDVFKALLGAGQKDDAGIAARTQVLEDRAFAVLEALTPKTISGSEQALGTWVDALAQRQAAGHPIAALEQLTLIHALKSPFLGAPELAAVVEKMGTVLDAADLARHGSPRTREEMLHTRWPRSSLASESTDVQKIHAAIFQEEGSGLAHAAREFFANYQPKAQDPVLAAVLLGSLFTSTGAQLLGGALHGYVMGTFVERAIHEHIGHASQKTLKQVEGLLSKFGPIGKAVWQAIDSTHFSHAKLHHGMYGSNYVDGFAPDDPNLSTDEAARRKEAKKTAMEAMVERRGPAEVAEHDASGYGVQLAHALRNAMMIAPLTATTTLLTGTLAGAAGIAVGPAFVAASVAASLLFVPASNNLHQYLHMTRDEAMSKAGPMMRAFLNSRYVGYINRHHYNHHQQADANFNLVPGADLALGANGSTVETIVALRRMKAIY
jgi:hypothetical protein